MLCPGCFHGKKIKIKAELWHDVTWDKTIWNNLSLYSDTDRNVVECSRVGAEREQAADTFLLNILSHSHILSCVYTLPELASVEFLQICFWLVYWILSVLFVSSKKLVVELVCVGVCMCVNLLWECSSNILNSSEKISLCVSCVLPLMKVCHRPEILDRLIWSDVNWVSDLCESRNKCACEHCIITHPHMLWFSFWAEEKSFQISNS